MFINKKKQRGFIKQLELYEKLNKRLPTVDEAMNRKEEKYVLELLQFYHNIYLYDKIDTFRAEMEGRILSSTLYYFLLFINKFDDQEI